MKALYNGQPTCRCVHPINSTDLTVLSASSGHARVFKLLSGHLPNPSSPTQVLASFTLQQDDGVRVGTIIHVPFYAASQLSAVSSATSAPKPDGPTVALQVVGIEASEGEFPSGSTPSYTLYTSRAFARTLLPRMAAGDLFLVRLHHDYADLARFDSQVGALAGNHLLGVTSENEIVASIEESIRPQAIGWWLLAALTGIIGLAVIGQALARQSFVESEEYPALSALGAGRVQLLVLGMMRTLALALVGALGSVALATVLSPLTPVGEGRIAETSSGIKFDPLILGLGAIAVALLVLALGVGPALRAARVSSSSSGVTEEVKSSVVARYLSGLGAPPSVLIGVRNALQRGSGRATLPVISTIFGTVLVVVVLCSTVVFGASLSHLTGTSALYGDDFNLNFTVYAGQPNTTLLTALERDRAVTGVTRGVATEISINHVAVGAIAATADKGNLLFSTIAGHLPRGRSQIALGGTTMRQVGAHLGSLVDVTVTTPSGARHTVVFRVVSRVALPVLGGIVGLANGAVLTIPAYEMAVCQTSTSPRGCERGLAAGIEGGLLVRMAPGAKGRSDIAHYLSTYPSVTATPITPSSLVNFGEAVNFPFIFGGILAIFGAATLAHLLVVSVSRRRRDMGLLKVLGFVNAQVITSVAWQSTTVALISAVIGMPGGLVLGRTVWQAFAGQLGVVPVVVFPLLPLAILVLCLFIVAIGIATGPALVATRATAGELLHNR